MENSSRRYFYKLKKKFKQFPKLALLSGVLLLLVFGNVSNVFAEYEDYLNLFSSSNEVPLKLDVKKTIQAVDTSNIPVIGGITNNISQANFQFQFSGVFDLQKNKVSWYWDHITDFDNSNVFLLRICSDKSTSDSDCYFSPMPYKSQMAADFNLFCKNGKCAIPDPSKDPTSKIYHYDAVILTSGRAQTLEGGDAKDKFNVLFDVPSLYKLNSGKLSSAIDPNTVFKIGDPNSYKADLWYCGEKNSSNDILPPDNQNDDSIRHFGGLCHDNLPYFKIASSQEFKMPSSITEAQNSTSTVDQYNTTTQQDTDNLPACSWTGGLFGSGTLMGCASRLIYYVIYWPIAWFAGLMGNLFDFFLGYSLADASYRANFAVKGWQLVRDISNIFFILILVWTGLATIFDFGGKSSINMKRVVPNLILSALLINFSLFVTRVVIDISNITARIFYNQIHVCEGDCRDDNSDGVYDNPLNGPGGFTSVSSKIVAQFNPQKLFSPGVLNDQASNQEVRGTNIGGSDPDTREAGYFIIVTLMAAAIIFGVAMMFWKTAFFFLGRVIGLYIAMIFAPFAFISMGNMPIVSSVKDLSWNSWIKDLSSYALLAPIFVFFLYLISSLMNSSLLTVYDGQQSKSFFETVIFILIPMLIVYFMVDQGVKIAKNYAGLIGNKIQEYSQKAIGFAAGAAMGGTALLGGRVLGGAASALNKSTVGLRLRDVAAKNKGLKAFLARQALGGLKGASEGSYDIRQSGLGKNLFKEMDIKTDSKHLDVLKNAGLGLSVTQRKGGRDADIKRREERREKREELFKEKMSDEDIKKYNDRQEKRRQNNVDGYVHEMMQAQFGKAVVEQWKQNDEQKYKNAKNTLLKQQSVQDQINQEFEPAKKIKSVDELNAARRENYIKSLQTPGFMGKGLEWMNEHGMRGLATALDSTIGATVGRQVRAEGNKLAAKKLEEKNKTAKKLSEIKDTLKSGFQNLIAIQKYQNSSAFQALSAQKQNDLINHGKIQFDPNNPNDLDTNKTLYDFLGQQEQNSIDNEIKSMQNDKSEAGKNTLKQYQTMVSTMETNRYDMKQLGQEVSTARQKMLTELKNPNASSADKQMATQEFLDKIREKQIADEHMKKWRDADKYQKDLEEKLKEKKEDANKKP